MMAATLGRPSWRSCVPGILAIVIGCGDADAPPAGDTVLPRDQTEVAGEDACAAPQVRQIVEQFGAGMRDVPTLAAAPAVSEAIREVYGPLVTPELLDAWLAAPDEAPGREVSSPWPDTIEVHAVEAMGDVRCLVEGELLYRTSGDARGEVAGREGVRAEVLISGEPRIAMFERADSPPPEPTVADAVAVIHTYYRAIAEGDLPTAYRLWGNEGTASGQSYEEFELGYRETERVVVETGEPGEVEGAAGSRFIEIPVVIRAVTTLGEEQHFEGSYTLRRAVADGASAEARAWQLASADVRQLR